VARHVGELAGAEAALLLQELEADARALRQPFGGQLVTSVVQAVRRDVNIPGRRVNLERYGLTL
jgi:hypothetical protein